MCFSSCGPGRGGDDSKLKMYCWQRRENVYLGPRKFETGELGLGLRFDHSRELVTFDICENAWPYRLASFMVGGIPREFGDFSATEPFLPSR